ncbi:MAG: serine/threonine protein kinase [Chitinispirillaceae bacterium]|nr:serine/threonine protein kinase [Chitinispirillaceae bacterium]
MANVRTINSADYIGKEFGNVTIVKEIGRGAMGIVLLGFQKSLKRQVAVKILPKALRSSTSSLDLFRDEGETVAVLSHPNIIPIFEMGETETCYFQVMQYVEGENLRTIIKSRLNHPLPSKRLLPLHQTASIICDVLDALGYAHEEGVVHQDVKPSNIIIDRRRSRPFIMDFGIARVLIAEYKSEGKVVGSPLYMSPEQANGYDTDGRSDIYSLGIILFEMMIGNLPTGPGTATEILMCKQSEPERFFAKTPRQALPTMNERLEQIILKATAPQPEQRYQDCRSFLIDLEPFAARPGVT